MRRFSFSLRALLLVIAIVGVGLAAWRVSTATSRNRQRLIDELQSRNGPLSFKVDRSVPAALAHGLYYHHELPYVNEAGETRRAMIFFCGMTSYFGDNPKLILVTKHKYEVLSSLSYSDVNSGSVLFAALSNAEIQEVQVYSATASPEPSRHSFVLTDKHIRQLNAKP